MFIILLAMVVVAAAALLIDHYAFAHTSVAPPITTTTSSLAKAYRACVTDGATLDTAIAAFKAENPDLNPTESALVSSGLGGPYLQSWVYNPQFYTYSLTNGVLYLRAATDATKPIRFSGPNSCLAIGL